MAVDDALRGSRAPKVDDWDLYPCLALHAAAPALQPRAARFPFFLTLCAMIAILSAMVCRLRGRRRMERRGCREIGASLDRVETPTGKMRRNRRVPKG